MKGCEPVRHPVTGQQVVRALSIRQPYVEAILRGEKTIEYRSRATRILNEPFYLYASKIAGPAEMFDAMGFQVGDLPTGLLVGIAEISHCHQAGDRDYHWYLNGVICLDEPVVAHPKRRPQPMWWLAF